MDNQQGSKGRVQVLFGGESRHGLGEAPERYVEKLLHHLVAYNAVSAFEAIPNEGCRSLGLNRRVGVERINEDISVEEISSAHSFRRV